MASSASCIPGELRTYYEERSQAHVFEYCDAGKLTIDQSAALVAQLKKIDLDRIANIHKAAMVHDKAVISADFTPIEDSASVADAAPADLDAWQAAGFEAISKGEVAACVLSGGAGTRLGFPFPKGIYDVGLPSGKPIFQLFAERLQKLAALAGSKKAIPWYIMTSEGENDTLTREFFLENSYFGYPREDVKFFPQGTLPCMTEEGKLMLETGSKVGQAADGNGGIYEALRSNDCLAEMETRGVKYLHVFSVDNAIGKVCDPQFIGYCVSKGADLGNKVVWKCDAGEKVGVLGNRGGHPGVIEYSEIGNILDEAGQKIVEKTDASGKLLFGAGNICNHFYSTEFLSRVTDDALIFHVARKKIDTPSEDGQSVVKAAKENGIKLECFIFDCFGLANNMAVLEGLRDEEFSPVKNPPGSATDSPDSARAMLTAQSYKWLEAAGIKCLKGQGQVELSPLVSYRGEGLETLKEMLGDAPLDCRRDVYIDVADARHKEPRVSSLNTAGHFPTSSRWAPSA